LVVNGNGMDFIRERKQFLYEFASHLDFVLLTANKSVSDELIQSTPDLPWNITDRVRRPVPKDYFATLQNTHTAGDQYEWNYMEALCNPYWTWDTMGSLVVNAMANPLWTDRFGRWWFHNWSRNNAIMRTSQDKVIDSLRKYVAATKIKRTFKKCVTTPTHPICISRLRREFFHDSATDKEAAAAAAAAGPLV
jgi:hypothetical protein